MRLHRLPPARQRARVHALHGRLAAALGSEPILMDVNAIELGTDFVASIREATASCELMFGLGFGALVGLLAGARVALS